MSDAAWPRRVTQLELRNLIRRQRNLSRLGLEVLRAGANRELPFAQAFELKSPVVARQRRASRVRAVDHFDTSALDRGFGVVIDQLPCQRPGGRCGGRRIARRWRWRHWRRRMIFAAAGGQENAEYNPYHPHPTPVTLAMIVHHATMEKHSTCHLSHYEGPPGRLSS